MNYQKYILKLTSIQFLVPKSIFQHQLFFHIVVILILLVQISTIKCLQSNTKLFENDYLKSLYDFKSVTSSQKLTLKQLDRINIGDLSQILATKQSRYAKQIEITESQLLFENKQEVTLIDLFFPFQTYGKLDQLETTIKNESLDLKKFNLQFLNLSNNGLRDQFFEGFSVYDQKSKVYSTVYGLILVEYFSHLRLVQLSYNKLRHLERKHFELFGGSQNRPSELDTLLLNSNEISSIRHDTFCDLKNLKNIDLSSNKLKLIHPLTFSYQSLNSIDLSNNMLKALFETPSSERSQLKNLYLSKNNQILCDCGLLWLYGLKSQINLDDFECLHEPTKSLLRIDQMENDVFLNETCQHMPKLYVDTRKLEETSDISLFRMLSKRWFQWTVFHDHLPTTTPFPYLMSSKNNTTFIEEEEEESKEVKKHVFHSWRLKDVIFECSNVDPESNNDETNSAIVWKTQYGYFGNLDQDLIQSISETQSNDSLSQNVFNSFKLFYKMNKLTKISQKLTVVVGKHFGAETRSEMYVNSKNQLVVTNFRQPLAGPYTCISVNENGAKMYEYNMIVRTGMNEYFIYSLFVSLISMIIPSFLGMIICCYCEYDADKNYPMTPACYPTPMANTPPNFDFNEWMANAAKYLPNVNLNIHETLEQVNKRLRKGMEKATVTVKSLGLTSHAYINSMYEQSTQRWSEMKGYRPNINMPTISLPTMKYPPVGQLANRMRMGVGNMLLQMREFCGTSDLTHTVSFNDLETETNAFNQIGSAFNLNQFDVSNNIKPNGSKGHHHGHSRLNSQYHNFYRFLHLMREARQRERNTGNQISESESTTPDSQREIVESMEINEMKPLTSMQAELNSSVTLPSTSTSETTVASSLSSTNKGEKRIYVKIINKPNENIEDDDNEDDDDDSDNESENDFDEIHKNHVLHLEKESLKNVNNNSNLKLNPDDTQHINAKKKNSSLA